MTTTFDPEATLPAPPAPWAPMPMPSLRSGPPYHMTDMIAAEPALARRLLARLAGRDAVAGLASAIRDAVEAREPVVVTGCGTSEHAAFGFVDIVRFSLRAAGLPAGPTAVVAAQALELALDPPAGGLMIGISHEGGSAWTNHALEAARAHGAQVGVVTASGGSPSAALGDIVVTTDEMDEGWCHTIGYVAPLLAAVAVGAAIEGRPLDADAAASALADGARDEPAAERIASALAGARHLLVIGSGVDRTTSRELVLKIEEAAYIPSAHRDLETFLHGHLPATDRDTGIVLVLLEPAGRDARILRARQALAAARVVGSTVTAIVADGVDRELPAELTPGGRLVVPDGTDPGPGRALLAGATALQLVTERIARAAGTNPDAIRREDARYSEAAAAAE